MMMRASTKRVTTLGFCLLCVMLGSLVYQAEGQSCLYYCEDRKAYNFYESCPCKYKGCKDKKADNYDRKATKNDGSCKYSGCKDKKADNYDRKATKDDGSCKYRGCTDKKADNYDRKANKDDGSCEYRGCTDRKAYNYDRKATKGDGSCKYRGCTDKKADNYDRKADKDDGSCEYPVPVVVPGCLDATANNFDIRATVDDGSCDFSVPGCTSVTAVNFNPVATRDDGSCIQLPVPVDVDVEEPLPEPKCSSEDETCCDTQPPSSVYSCEEEKNFGKCGESWMQGYCAFTCGRCGQSKLGPQRIEVRMKEAKQMRVVMEAEQIRAKRLWREVEESEVQKWEEGICEKLAGCCETYGKKECAKACNLRRKGKVNLPKDEAELERMRGVLVEDLNENLDQCGANRDQVAKKAQEAQEKVCKKISGCCSDPSVDPKQCVRACNEVKKRSGSRRCDAAPDIVKGVASDLQAIDELQAQGEKNEEELSQRITEIEAEQADQAEKVKKEAESARRCGEDYFKGANVCKELECDWFCKLLDEEKQKNPAYKKALDEEKQKKKDEEPGLGLTPTYYEAKLSREKQGKLLGDNIASSIKQRETDDLKDVRTSTDMKKKEVNDAAKNSRDMLEQKVQQGLDEIQARSNDAAKIEEGAQRERERREEIRQAAERKAAAAERKAAQAAAQAERKAAAAQGPQGEQPQAAPQGGQQQGEQVQAQAAPQGGQPQGGPPQFRRIDVDVNAASDAGQGQEDEAGKGQEDAGQGQEDEAAVQELEVSLTCTYLNGTQFTSRSLNSSTISEVEFTAMELLDFLNVPEEITSTELAGISCAEAEKPKCYPNDRNEFVFRVKSVKDQYEVEGCEGVAPTLDMQRGVEYTLVQEDLTNWEQPLGLAYYPGGAPNGVPELEEPTPPECGEEQYLCDPGEGVEEAPLYCVNGTCASSVDAYQPYFQKSQEEWEAEGPYALKITIPEDSQTIEFYYFSRLHPGKSGMIAVEDTTEDSVPDAVQEDISPLALLRGGL